MPNYCNYSMCVVGAKENVEEFIRVINADYDYGTMEFSCDRHMFRVFEATCDEIEERGDGKFQTVINGYCAWSVSSCMLEGGYYRDCKERYGENFRGTTLRIESQRLNLDIEVYSEESGMCFQEHYIFNNGNLVCDECRDWCEYWLDDYETKEEAEAELGITITDNEWEEGECFSRGGFKTWDFEI
jgi:hypothetical protein